MGLSISKRFVELMGGQIYVDTKPEQGSTFGFVLSLPVSTNIDPSSAGASEPAADNGPNVISFEPFCAGRWEIAEAMKNLKIAVEHTDNIEVALGWLKAQTSEANKRRVLIVDMVRYADASNDLLKEIEKSKLSAKTHIVRVGSGMLDCEQPSASGTNPLTTIFMPLERQAINNSICAIDPSSRRGDRFHAEKTMQLGQLQWTNQDEKLVLPGQKKVALVADDNEVNRRVARLFLTDLGFQVDLVLDGVEAVQAFKAQHYDIVFWDCQMPRLDGFGAAKIIKELQNRRGVAVPLIAITANAAKGTKEECLANDMDDYLSKPIDPQDLERLIETWLGRTPSKPSFQKSKSVMQACAQGTPATIVTLNKLRQTFVRRKGFCPVVNNEFSPGR